MRDTMRYMGELAADRAGKLVTVETLRRRARRDLREVVKRFAAEYGPLLEDVRRGTDEKEQSAIGQALDVVREQYLALEKGLDECWLMEIWYETVENDEMVRWALCDLEYEKDKRLGNFMKWKKHSRRPVETVEGEQLAMGL